MRFWTIGLSIFFSMLLCRQVKGNGYERGTPFFIQYSSDIYRAHDRNQDVVCDGKGNVYFANLEGVLKYDGSSWFLITTPGISRITALAVGIDGRVYAGGLHVAGFLEENGNGESEFRAYWPDSPAQGKIGEVEKICIEKNKVIFVASEMLLVVEQDSVYQRERREEEEKKDLAGCYLPDGRRLVASESGLWVKAGTQEIKLTLPGLPEDVLVNDILKTPDGQIIIATAAYGVFILSGDLQLRSVVDENKGLMSNVINGLADDEKGSVWLATGKGVVRLLYSAMFRTFTEKEGLTGEVISVVRYNGKLYTGTYRGVFYWDAETGKFRPVPGITQACWQLSVDDKGRLWAATSHGVFRIEEGTARSVSHYFTMCVGIGDEIYTGEQNALYSNEWKDGRLIRKECLELGQVNQIVTDKKGIVWVATISGDIGKIIHTDSGKFIRALHGLKNDGGNRIYLLQGELLITAEDGFYREMGKDSVVKFAFCKDTLESDWWPGLCVEDKEGKIWLTRGDGKMVRVMEQGSVFEKYSVRLKALEDYAIRVIYPEQNGVVWLGGSFGLIRADLEMSDVCYRHLPEVYIREFKHSPDKPRNVAFRFATDAADLVGQLKFSCRLRGVDRDWGDWQENRSEEYKRLPYGSYVFQVRVRDIFGRIGYSPEIGFEVPAPYYLRWPAVSFYVLSLVFMVLLAVRWRTGRLLRDKLRLEKEIESRTIEVRRQRDEIKEKSFHLEQTLSRLQQTQNELIRQEKMATIGKLTQGLVDRILNPLNYIGNFALLSVNLTGEASRIMAEEGEKIPSDIRIELNEMMELLKANLEKIILHGESTARVLKAMEEILKEKKCVLKPVEIGEFCRENLKIFQEYWKKELEEKEIEVELRNIPEERMAEMDREQFGKVLISILNNSLSALLKKGERVKFRPRLVVGLENAEKSVKIAVHDNGVGIESQVLDKVFDPFFTTRTTTEAAGVGLYLSREVVLNHGGKIGIHSEQGVGTTVWIEISVL